jgi:hypothetical protein
VGKLDFAAVPFINAAVEYPERSHSAHRVITAQRRWVWDLFHRAAADAKVRQANALADQLTLLYDSALVGSQLAGDATPATRAREAARTLVAAASRRERAQPNQATLVTTRRCTPRLPRLVLIQTGLYSYQRALDAGRRGRS